MSTYPYSEVSATFDNSHTNGQRTVTTPSAEKRNNSPKEPQKQKINIVKEDPTPSEGRMRITVNENSNVYEVETFLPSLA
jgi:hypothetical protein